MQHNPILIFSGNKQCFEHFTSLKYVSLKRIKYTGWCGLVFESYEKLCVHTNETTYIELRDKIKFRALGYYY